MSADYVPDHLYERLLQPWTLPKDEWALAREDWARVRAICDFPWHGRVVDVGAGDGTLAAMVRSFNPLVTLYQKTTPIPVAMIDTEADWAEAEAHYGHL